MDPHSECAPFVYPYEDNARKSCTISPDSLTHVELTSVINISVKGILIEEDVSGGYSKNVSIPYSLTDKMHWRICTHSSCIARQLWTWLNNESNIWNIVYTELENLPELRTFSQIFLEIWNCNQNISVSIRPCVGSRCEWVNTLYIFQVTSRTMHLYTELLSR